MNKFALATSVPLLLTISNLAGNCISKTSKEVHGAPYDKIRYSVSALSDNICKLKAEKSANFNNAMIYMIFLCWPPFRGISP